jgi:hypothetical protein
VVAPRSDYRQVLQPVAVAVQPRISVHCAGDDLQLTVLHVASGPQVTPHEQDSPQLTLVHEFRPLQSTLQRPRPHERLRQVPRAVQLTLQDVLLRQLMPDVQAFSTEHITLQDQPAGQVTCSLQPPLSAQSTVHVLALLLHDVHCDGQASASAPESTCAATQKPSMQVRPDTQSDCLSHAKSPLRWLIEQAASTATVKAHQMCDEGLMARRRSRGPSRRRDRARSE